MRKGLKSGVSAIALDWGQRYYRLEQARACEAIGNFLATFGGWYRVKDFIVPGSEYAR